MQLHGDSAEALREMCYTWLLKPLGLRAGGEGPFAVALLGARTPTGGVQLQVVSREPTPPEALAVAREELFGSDWPDPEHPSLDAAFGAFCPEDGAAVTLAVFTERGLERGAPRLREDPRWPPPLPAERPAPTSPEGIRERLSLLNQARFLAHQVKWATQLPVGSPERLALVAEIERAAKRMQERWG